MKKLTYWLAPHLTDHRCYSIRATSLKQCNDLRKSHGEEIYGKPRKVVIEYNGTAFGLLDTILSEGFSETGVKGEPDYE